MTASLFSPRKADKVRFNEEKQMIIKHLLLPIPTDPKLKIDVSRLSVSVLIHSNLMALGQK